jgi:dipeptidase
MLRLVLCGGAFAFVAAKKDADHCTAVAAGPKATVDGSAMVGQTADAEGGPGTSTFFVPAADHAPGSMRAIYDQQDFLNGKDTVTGHVAEVAHTYAYTKGRYGLMNEHQLAFGESTCSGRIAAPSIAHNGSAIWSNRELTLVSLERCKTARCAIALMGKLAMEGGFYGEDDGVDTGSENLMVADPTEAWVFHILADPTGKSAIWGAAKVPDDKIAFAPNVFIIREMDLKSSDFMLSSNAVSIAKEYGWWSGPDGTFDFAGAYSLGEYANPYYGARRLWRAYNLLAPSLKLDPSNVITDKSNGGYPFAVKPDKLLTTADIFTVYRDYYEGTPFSLVKNEVAAGPFNSPTRIAAGAAEGNFAMAAWERPIGIYRADHAYVNAVRSDGHGVVWVGPHVCYASVFAPVWTSVATKVSRRYFIDKSIDVDRESLFWAVSAVQNWATGSMFNLAIKDIRVKQKALEDKSHALATSLQSAAPAKHNDMLGEFADKVHTTWWDLFWSLMYKYSDGYVVTRDASGAPVPTAVGYPSWYLEAVHFDKGLDANVTLQFHDQKARIGKATEQYAKIVAQRNGPTITVV